MTNERATAKPIFPLERAGSDDSNDVTRVEGNQSFPDREEGQGKGSSTDAFRSTVKEDEGCREGSAGVPAAVTGEASSRLSDVREVEMRSSLPVVELFESIRDPVDEANFDERKRGISSSMKKVSCLSLPPLALLLPM